MLILWTCMCLLDLAPIFVFSQKLDNPRGPWRLAFKVYNGTLYQWNSSAIGHSTMWGLFSSADSFSGSDISSYEPFKSKILQDWENRKINVQAIKMSFIKDNREEAHIVFNGFARTKSTWFTCDNILYATYTDLPDASIANKVACPGTTTSGFPFSIQNKTFLDGPCDDTTGWTVVADTDLTWSVCTQYAPYDGPEPYFKYSRFTRIAHLKTELESADSLEIYLQVWDMVFKGIDGIKPSNPYIKNLTDLWLSDATENENDPSTLTLTYSPVKTFKSRVAVGWGSYYIDTVKYSMFDGGLETAYVVFDGRGSDIVSWFDEENIVYTNYDIDAHKPLEACSIDGDLSRHWQIQKLADPAGCSDNEQLGWMLVKEPRNNGTCPWDIKQGKVKPYFLYSTQAGPTNPENFQTADVMAVFVHGWRLVLKVSANGSVSPRSNIYNLWTENGVLNEDIDGAKSLEPGTLTYKAGVVDIWDSLVVRAVKLAAYRNGVEDFHIVFDALGETRTSWFDCSRVLYTSVNGLDRDSLRSYTCSMKDPVSSLSFLIGRDPSCTPMSAIGVFGIIDTDNRCSARIYKPQFIFSTQYDTTISDVPSGYVHLADTFAIFLDMENCWTGLCRNGATCDDRGGYFTCFCAGQYYGETCSNLDGTYQEWTLWSECTVTCGGGSSSRTRECVGAEGDGQCYGASRESVDCNTDPCPIDGGFSEWTLWTTCSEECGTGSRNRSRDCNNPEPQYGGDDCTGERSQDELCNTHNCPIDGGWSVWTAWSACPVTCSGGNHSRSRICNNPVPQYGGQDCAGNSSESEDCNTEICPAIHGGWSEWSNWTECPVTCGKNVGQQSRNRTCDNPVPEWGGDDCAGDSEETVYCNDFYCPMHGGWGNWTAWSDCYDLDNAVCGTGVTVRTRVCDSPPAQYGGEPCPGESTEIQGCTEACANIQCDPDNPSECEMTFKNSGATNSRITLISSAIILSAVYEVKRLSTTYYI